MIHEKVVVKESGRILPLRVVHGVEGAEEGVSGRDSRAVMQFHTTGNQKGLQWRGLGHDLPMLHRLIDDRCRFLFLCSKNHGDAVRRGKQKWLFMRIAHAKQVAEDEGALVELQRRQWHGSLGVMRG